MYIYVYTYIYVYNTRDLIHRSLYADTQILLCRHSLSHTHTDTHTHTYRYSLTHIQILSHTHTDTLTHTWIGTHGYTEGQAYVTNWRLNVAT